MDDFDLRLERAALEGAVLHKDTLSPFVAEAVTQAARELDETQRKIEALSEPQWDIPIS